MSKPKTAKEWMDNDVKEATGDPGTYGTRVRGAVDKKRGKEIEKAAVDFVKAMSRAGGHDDLLSSDLKDDAIAAEWSAYNVIGDYRDMDDPDDLEGTIRSEPPEDDDDATRLKTLKDLKSRSIWLAKNADRGYRKAFVSFAKHVDQAIRHKWYQKESISIVKPKTAQEWIDNEKALLEESMAVLRSWGQGIGDGPVAEDDKGWRERMAKNPATGRMVQIGSLPQELQQQYKPKHLASQEKERKEKQQVSKAAGYESDSAKRLAKQRKLQRMSKSLEKRWGDERREIKSTARQARQQTEAYKQDWKNKTVKSTTTGRTIKVGSLPPDEQAKYRPKKQAKKEPAAAVPSAPAAATKKAAPQKTAAPDHREGWKSTVGPTSVAGIGMMRHAVAYKSKSGAMVAHDLDSGKAYAVKSGETSKDWKEFGDVRDAIKYASREVEHDKLVGPKPEKSLSGEDFESAADNAARAVEKQSEGLAAVFDLAVKRKDPEGKYATGVPNVFLAKKAASIYEGEKHRLGPEERKQAETVIAQLKHDAAKEKGDYDIDPGTVHDDIAPKLNSIYGKNRHVSGALEKYQDALDSADSESISDSFSNVLDAIDKTDNNDEATTAFTNAIRDAM